MQVHIMMIEIVDFFKGFWVVFSFSFLVALTGAMSPGPLLTYTIIKSVKSDRYGYLMGVWIILGHAILEMFIILLLLFGFSFILKHALVTRIIGIVGGFILVLFGLSIVRDVKQGNVSTTFLTSSETNQDEPDAKDTQGMNHPVIGGILVSMSNPYWWIWWATIGFAFMIQFNVSFQEWPKLIAFFIGHEAGDLVWYLFISCLAFFGIRHLNRNVYYGILFCCGMFMIFFGVYLGVSPFFTS